MNILEIHEYSTKIITIQIIRKKNKTARIESNV